MYLEISDFLPQGFYNLEAAVSYLFISFTCSSLLMLRPIWLQAQCCLLHVVQDRKGGTSHAHFFLRYHLEPL